MTPIEIRNSVFTLHQQGASLREMSRLLGLSRNTVRRILREPAVATARVAALDEATQQRLKAVYERAKGNAVRMGQILGAEYDQWLPSRSRAGCVRPSCAAGRQALGRVPLRARPGDAARHLAAPDRSRRQAHVAQSRR